MAAFLVAMTSTISKLWDFGDTVPVHQPPSTGHQGQILGLEIVEVGLLQDLLLRGLDTVAAGNLDVSNFALCHIWGQTHRDDHP